MKKYTKKQIQIFKDYLNYNVKEGVFDEDFANEIIEKKDWQEVHKMIDEADAFYEALNRGEA